jgi:membrane protease YdiL (CAAX protease family)
VTKRRASGTRSKTRSAPVEARFGLDPLFACLVFAGMGLGTLALGASPRLAILWTTLLVLWVAYREGKPLQLQYQFAEIGRGALIGLAVGVPLAVLAFRALATAIPILFVSVSQTSLAGVSSTMVFVSLVLLAPVAEDLFFRDILQRHTGIALATGLYAAAGLIFFLPTAGQFPVVLVAVAGVWSVLGAMYSFFYERLGFAATLACHITINFVLLFIPAVLSRLDLFARYP